MNAIKKFFKPIVLSVLNLYFHSDEKSMAFIRNLLKKESAKISLLNTRDIESILASLAQDEYDFSHVNVVEKVVVFFEIAYYRMCGGQMSLFSYCKYSKEILGDSAAVLMTTIPGKYTYNHNEHFDNDIDICRWEQIREILKGKQNVILHIPEVLFVHPETGEEGIRKAFLDDDFDLLRSIPNLHINIVNQQIELMPPPEKYRWLYSLTENVTTTICNKTSATQCICNKIGTPLHMLSVYYDWGKIKRIPLKKKEKLILLSPDLPSLGLSYKVNFIKKINDFLPDYKIFIIKNLKLQECMRLTAVAAAVVTFGEGFDGYLNNSPQVGTLAFAVYNDVFFPDNKWKNLPNIYASYDDMLEHFVDDLQKFMDNEKFYMDTVSTHEKYVLDLYKFDEYIDNLTRFYESRYDFYPELNCVQE